MIKLKGIHKLNGKMKVCESTKAVTGCGKNLPIGNFQRTGKGGRMKVCQKCLSKPRDKTVRRKHETNEESELFNQFDKLKRGAI